MPDDIGTSHSEDDVDGNDQGEDHYATLSDVRKTDSWSDDEIDTLLGLYEKHMNELRSDQTVNLFWAAIAQRMQSKAYDVSKSRHTSCEISE